MYMCMYMFMYMYMYICVYMHMHMNIYVHVHVNRRACTAENPNPPTCPTHLHAPNTHQRATHLEDSDERPEQRVEVLPLEATRHRRVVDVGARTRVARVDVGAELAAEQMHAKYAETRHVSRL